MEQWDKNQLYQWISQFNVGLAKKLKKSDFEGESFVELLENENFKEECDSLGISAGLRLKLKKRYNDYKNEVRIITSITVHDPTVNALYERMASTFSCANMAIRDGLSGTLAHAPSDIIAGLQRGLSFTLSETLCDLGSVTIQAHDAIAPGALLALQFGVNIYRWYCGDITGKQFIKNMTTNVAGVLGGFGGTAAGVATAVAIGSSMGVVAGPAGIAVGGIIGAIIGGLFFSGLTRAIVEAICPDGDLENFITKRNEMIQALENLGCTENSSDEEIKQAWKNGCLLYHPDRNKDVWDKDAQERWLIHQLSYEVVKTYNEVIQKGKKALNFNPSENLTNSDILSELKVAYKQRKEEIETEVEDPTLEREEKVVQSEEFIFHWVKKEEDLKIEKKSKRLKDLEYYNDCLEIHYKNRGITKNRVRKLFDTLNNPVKVIKKQPTKMIQ